MPRFIGKKSNSVVIIFLLGIGLGLGIVSEYSGIIDIIPNFGQPHRTTQDRSAVNVQSVLRSEKYHA
jgi:hypothetical protein